MWLCALFLALLAAPADAADYDPSLRWQVLTTPHFRVHFHDGEESLARDMSVRAEAAWATLTPAIGTAPDEGIDLVLVDHTDDANGYATIVPRNTIVIFVTAPTEDSTLSFYEDWNEGIVTHELTHILHMDTVGGLPRVARALLGTIISTNQASPGWIVEGYATFEETRHTAAGRGRSPLVDMMKRTAVLEDAFPALSTLDGFQAAAPAGNLRYLWGQDFLRYIADTAGEDAWRSWIHLYGRSLPFYLPAKRVFGKDFRTLYAEWRAESIAKYTAQAEAWRAEGLTPYTYLTPRGASCGVPAWKPDGSGVAVGCSDFRKGSDTWFVSPDGEKRTKLVPGVASRTVAWRADGTALAYTRAHTVRLYNSWDDAYLYDLASKTTRSLTRDARARDAAFSPDGERLYVVTNGAQDTKVQVLTVDQRLVPLIDEDGATQYGTPVPSPDGKLLAVSAWKDGERDLWLYDAASGAPVRRLTHDAAVDREPAWSADGKVLYFASDRGGKPDIYAADLGNETLWRVTNVLTGAWGPAPSPDGRTLAFDVYGGKATRVATMPLDRATWKPLGALPTPALQETVVDGAEGVPSATPPPPVAVTVVAQPPAPVAEAVDVATTPPAATPPVPAEEGAAPGGSDAASDIRPYSPWKTLFPPRFWVPGTYLTSTGDSLGLYAVASTAARDTLGYASYGGYLTYRTDARFVGGGGSVVVNRWRPVVSASGSTAAWPYGDIYRATGAPTEGGATVPGVETTRRRYWDRRVRGALGVAYPLTEKSSVSASWQGTLRSPLDPLPADAALAYLPTRGFFSSVAAGWRTGSTTSYGASISPEKGRSLALGVEATSRALGSWTYDDAGAVVPFDQLQATAEGRWFVPVRRFPNHVLAVRAAGGASVGDTFRYGSFRLGGDFSEGGLTVIPSEWRMLRGFYPASDSGEGYWLTSGEYRFPIATIDRGIGTLPAFARNLSGAVYVDAGDAFDAPSDITAESTLVGVGAELRALFVVGWGAGLYTRLGYGFGAHGGGKPLGSLDGLYLSLGSSF